MDNSDTLDPKQTEVWKNTWKDIVSNSIEDSSSNSYASAIKNYVDWCGYKSMPLAADKTYCSWLWERVRYSSPGTYAQNTVEGWRSAISHNFKGSYHNPTRSDIAAVILQAVKKFCREPTQKCELRKSDLKRVLDDLIARSMPIGAEAPKEKFLIVRNALMLLIAFRTLFRCAELVGIEALEIFEEELTVEKTLHSQPSSCLLVLITQRKTVQQRKLPMPLCSGEVLVITGDELGAYCPIRWFHHYKWWKNETGLGDARKFFCSLKGEELSPRTFAHIIKDCVSRIGLDPKLFGGHSSRSDAASAAVKANVDIRLVKRLGFWKKQCSVSLRP